MRPLPFRHLLFATSLFAAASARAGGGDPGELLSRGGERVAGPFTFHAGMWQTGSAPMAEGEVLSLRWPARVSSSRTPSAVFLRDGSILGGQIVGLQGGELRLSSDLLGERTFGKNDLLGLVFGHPPGKAWALALPNAPGALLANGETVRGDVQWLNATMAALRPETRLLTLPRERLRSLRFTAEPEIPATASPWVALLTDGQRLVGNILELSATELVLATSYEPELRLPAHRLAALFAQGGDLVPLASLAFETSWVPEYDERGRIRLNQDQGGAGVRIAGRVMDLGVSLPARGSLTVQVPAAIRRFVSEIGIPDSAAPGSAATFVVEADGRERLRKTLRAGDAPVPLAVDLQGVRSLRLLVDFASPAPASARDAFWAHPVLLP